MSRLSLDQQIRNGILSPSGAGELVNKSSNTIRNWIDKKLVQSYTVPGSSKRERQISALELLRFVIKEKQPFSPDLVTAALNFARVYEPSYVPVVQDIGDAYTKTSIRDKSPALAAILSSITELNNKRLENAQAAALNKLEEEPNQHPLTKPITFDSEGRVIRE